VDLFPDGRVTSGGDYVTLRSDLCKNAVISLLSMKSLKQQLFRRVMWDFFIEIEMPHIARY